MLDPAVATKCCVMLPMGAAQNVYDFGVVFVFPKGVSY